MKKLSDAEIADRFAEDADRLERMAQQAIPVNAWRELIDAANRYRAIAARLREHGR